MGTGSFPEVKLPGRCVDHPPPPSAEVKERVELYLYSTSGPSWPVLGWTLPLPLHSKVSRFQHHLSYPTSLTYCDILRFFNQFLRTDGGQCLIKNCNRFLLQPHHFIHSYPSGLCSGRNSGTDLRISPLRTSAPQMFSKNSCRIPRPISALFTPCTQLPFTPVVPGMGGAESTDVVPVFVLKDTRRF